MSEMGVIEMSEREVRKQFQREMLEKLIDSELELRIVRPPSLQDEVILLKKAIRVRLTIQQIAKSDLSLETAQRKFMLHNEMVRMIQDFGYFTTHQLGMQGSQLRLLLNRHRPHLP